MKRLWLFSLSSLLLSACGGIPISSSSSESSSSEIVAESLSFSQKNEETSSLSSSEEPEPSSSSAISSAPLEELDYETLWDYGEAVSLSLSATPEAMYAFSRYGSDNSFTKYRDVYFPADFTVTVNGKTYVYEDVGIRMKGNTSRAAICDSSGVLNGDYCHFKISFKETFDDSIYNESALQAFKRDWSSNEAGRKARKKRTLAGMKKIDLKYCPRNEGKCYNQEIYAYDCFRKAGIPAINAKWATLTLNSGTSTWTASYEAVECYDKTFLSRYFPGDDEGDLYKCGQVVPQSESPTYADFALDGAVAKSVDASGYQSGTRIANGKIGIEDSYNGYHPNYDLKTNDDAGEGSDFSKMANLINAAYACRYNGAPLSLLESVLDLDWFLKYEAYAYLLGNY
ncbi:MAG: CotH kinase family protein, partial [Bacilli bacterium]|nr:CotH kinase family protein [Bacilli bacterium]